MIRETGAVPETYFTAWGSLFECLRLRKEDKLLIRGATCALGYVAIQLAKAPGCRVAGTAHKASRMQLLKEAGCDEWILDDGGESLRGKVRGITKALELTGPKTLIDTMFSVEEGAIVCNTGDPGGV